MLPPRRRILRWVADNLHLLKHTPQMPPELHDRAADNLRPLLAIADAGRRGLVHEGAQCGFMPYDLGYFDDEMCCPEPIENPFGRTVLPMSSAE
jgi:Protein of unknown function (DUF3631)